MSSGPSTRTGRLVVIAGVVGGLAGACETVGAVPPAKVRAVAFARAVNIVAADVPEFTRSASATSSDQASVIDECAGGGSAQRPLVRLRSPTFDRGSLQRVNSAVRVLPSPGAAARDIAEFNGARGRNCLRRALARSFDAQQHANVSYRHASLSFAPLAAPGSDGSLKLRYEVAVSQGLFSIRLYVDLLGFRLGSTIVTLTASGAGPFPAADEQRLVSLLLARAKTNRLEQTPQGTRREVSRGRMGAAD